MNKVNILLPVYELALLLATNASTEEVRTLIIMMDNWAYHYMFFIDYGHFPDNEEVLDDYFAIQSNTEDRKEFNDRLFDFVHDKNHSNLHPEEYHNLIAERVQVIKANGEPNLLVNTTLFCSMAITMGSDNVEVRKEQAQYVADELNNGNLFTVFVEKTDL